MLTPTSQVAILGFGTRAATLAALLAPCGCALRAWDPRLADAGGAALRVRIEAAGVDVFAELSTALRGARLVVLDTVQVNSALQAQLQAGQKILDLAAPAAHIDAVLAALGVPAAAHWAAACAFQSSAVANSTATLPDTPAVRRGELP